MKRRRKIFLARDGCYALSKYARKQVRNYAKKGERAKSFLQKRTQGEKFFVRGTARCNFLAVGDRGRRDSVSNMAKGREREKLLKQMRALAAAKVNDAVKLAYLSGEQLDLIDRLDLTAVTEFKRSGNGAVEVKFSDKMKAIEQLMRMEEDGGESKILRLLGERTAEDE